MCICDVKGVYSERPKVRTKNYRKECGKNVEKKGIKVRRLLHFID